MITLKTEKQAAYASRPSAEATEYRIANSMWDRLMSFRLVHEHYAQIGLIRENPFRFRVTKFHLQPTTQVFLAVQDQKPLFTVSLVPDGPNGLPMESIYHEEVAERRRGNRVVGEVTSLAGRLGDFRKFHPVFVQLTRLMAQYARRRGMDEFLIAVHPRHAGFYQRYLGFERIGPVRNYPLVQNAPAVACCLDFERIDRERPKCWYDFFGTTVPESELETRPMTDEEFQHYCSVADIGTATEFQKPRPKR